MFDIVFENRRLKTVQGETVLDTLARHGHDIPSGCRAGVCQSCLMKFESGNLPSRAQTALSDAQIALNYFLSCQCVPQGDIAVQRIATERLRTNATVVEKFPLSEQVIGLRLSADLDYLPGQYVTLWNGLNVGRSYSLASIPGDDYLEFHIRVVPDGQFSRWVKNQLDCGDSLAIQGPMGKCIFTARAEQPLLLCALGVGLAPLYGILRQALGNGHTAPIHLLLGAREPSGLYRIAALRELAEQHTNLRLHLVVRDGSTDGATQADIYTYRQQYFADLANWRVFLCGADTFVKKMRKHCFLSGAAMKDISADSFVEFPRG